MPLSAEQIASMDKITGLASAPTKAAPAANDTSAIDAAIAASSGKKVVTPDQESGAKFGATFKAKATDSPVVGALKTVGNIPSSAIHFAKNVFDFFNPMSTVGKAKDLGAGLADYADATDQPDVSVADVAKEFPHEAYKATVPAFLQSLIAGDTVEARRAIENDPVGQILPVLMIARQAAEKAGKVAEFDKGISIVAKPVTATGEAVVGAGKALAKQAVGRMTGAGANSIDVAAKAAAESPEAFDNFRKAMRGEIQPEEIVKSAQDAVQTIADNRRSAYSADLEKLGGADPKVTGAIDRHITSAKQVVDNMPEADLTARGGIPSLLENAKANIVQGLKGEGFADASKAVENVDATKFSNIDEFSTAVHDAVSAGTGKSLDISPVNSELTKQMKAFNIKIDENGDLDFSRSSIANNGTARADVQQVYKTVKDWGSQAGDRTPLGIDTLKKQLSDTYTESSQARAFVAAVKNKVTGILNEQVPGYSDMTKAYAQASQLLDDIKSATGAGGSAKIDTVFTKLTTALKSDKQLRTEILGEIESKGDQPFLMEKIAGLNLKDWFPKGLIGGGLDVGAGISALAGMFNPQIIPALLMTSPRVMGEFVSALGWTGAKKAAAMKALNTIAPHVPSLAPAATAEQNTKKKKP